MSNPREPQDVPDLIELLDCPFCGSDQVCESVGQKGDGTSWPYIECRGYPVDIYEAYVTFTAFDPADVAPVKLTAER